MRLKSSRSAKRSDSGASSRFARVISASSASTKRRRLTRPVSSSVTACSRTTWWRRAFSSAIAACEASHSASSVDVGREAALRRVDDEADLAAARRLAEVELDRLLADRLAHTRELAVVVEHASARGAGRLDRHVEDHGQQPARVVRRGERVADVRDRLARSRAEGCAPPPAAGARPRSSARAEDDEQAERDERRDDREREENRVYRPHPVLCWGRVNGAHLR